MSGYIKSKNLLKLFTCKFSQGIREQMEAAGEVRSAGDSWAASQKIDGIIKDKTLPLKTRAAVGVAWGFYSVGADSPLLLLVGAAAVILVPIQLILRAF